MSSRLLGIATRKAKRAPMETCAKAEITVEAGVGSDFRGKPGKRQISVLSKESWSAACKELNASLPWTVRRANLLVEGLHLKESTGSLLKIGDVTLEITDETDPCSRMDEQHNGLMAALTPDWRGGVLCRVLSGGSISVGDPVSMTQPTAKPE